MDENWTKRTRYQQAQTVFFVALSSRVKCYYWNKHFDFLYIKYIYKTVIFLFVVHDRKVPILIAVIYSKV